MSFNSRIILMQGTIEECQEIINDWNSSNKVVDVQTMISHKNDPDIIIVAIKVIKEN